jgi:V-type H+-transporting ATPase subunit C
MYPHIIFHVISLLAITDTGAQTDRKRDAKARKGMDSEFAYLAGNAFGRDKKGRVKKDEGMGGSGGADLVAGAGEVSGGEYSAYVVYTIDVD